MPKNVKYSGGNAVPPAPAPLPPTRSPAERAGARIFHDLFGFFVHFRARASTARPEGQFHCAKSRVAGAGPKQKSDAQGYASQSETMAKRPPKHKKIMGKPWKAKNLPKSGKINSNHFEINSAGPSLGNVPPAVEKKQWKNYAKPGKNQNARRPLKTPCFALGKEVAPVLSALFP
jgi:hypothetical protein